MVLASERHITRESGFCCRVRTITINGDSVCVCVCCVCVGHFRYLLDSGFRASATLAFVCCPFGRHDDASTTIVTRAPFFVFHCVKLFGPRLIATKLITTIPYGFHTHTFHKVLYFYDYKALKD